MIPWQVFVLMVDAMDSIEAAEQLFATQAVQHGYLAANNPTDPHIRRATERLKRAAFPKIRSSRPIPPDEVM